MAKGNNSTTQRAESQRRARSASGHQAEVTETAKTMHYSVKQGKTKEPRSQGPRCQKTTNLVNHMTTELLSAEC